MNAQTDHPSDASRAPKAKAAKPWYYHIPCVEAASRAWRKHPITGSCATLVLLLGLWGMWSAFEDTIAKRFLDPAAEAKAQAEQDAKMADRFGRVRDDLSRVAEEVVDTQSGVSSVGMKVDNVLTRIDEGNQITADVHDRLAELTASGQILVTLSPEKLAQLRQMEQPQLKLFWYDEQGSQIAFDDTAPEFEPGQFLHVKFVDPAGATPTHKYLLVIKSTGDVQLYPDELVNSPDVRGDWRIEAGVDNESLLVLAADHALSEQEQADLIASLKRRLPTDGLPIRRNMFYDWRNGAVYQLARASETRDLKRNPNAPADWVDEVNRALAEHNVAYHGITYPVNNEAP